MNILFVTDTDIAPQSGGVSRVVSILAGGLAKRPGYKCFLAYVSSSPDSPAQFEKKIKVDAQAIQRTLPDFIAEHQISVIIASTALKQNIKFLLPSLQQIAGKRIPVYFWYHSMPGYELAGTGSRVALYRIIHQKNKLSNAKKWLLGALSSAFCRAVFKRFFLQKKYAFIYNHADRIILLSSYWVTPFARYARLADAGKFAAIGNCLSFDVFATGEEVKEKEKIALIVARIDEDSKRITMALKVWRRVEKDGSGSDWKLFIVGSGDDERYCQRLARKWNLHNVVFTGRQDPLPYYRKASIFMMTSAHEGFPMTLGEAQQMGVVPIAFGSFSAVYDIIEHNHNGLIIPDKNIGEYARQLQNLMLDSSKRQQLAKNAIKSCQKLSVDKFIDKWVALLSRLK